LIFNYVLRSFVVLLMCQFQVS